MHRGLRAHDLGRPRDGAPGWSGSAATAQREHARSPSGAVAAQLHALRHASAGRGRVLALSRNERQRRGRTSRCRLGAAAGGRKGRRGALLIAMASAARVEERQLRRSGDGVAATRVEQRARRAGGCAGLRALRERMRPWPLHGQARAGGCCALRADERLKPALRWQSGRGERQSVLVKPVHVMNRHIYK